MGYPLDRSFENTVDTLQKFMTPNMFTTSVKIIHSKEIRQGILTASRSIPLREFNTDLIAKVNNNHDNNVDNTIVSKN